LFVDKTISYHQAIRPALIKEIITMANKKTNPSAATQKQIQARLHMREAVLKDYPAEVREHVEKADNLFKNDHDHLARTRHRLGVTLLAIRDAKATDGSTYGMKLIATLAELWDWDRGILYSAIKIANAYTETDLNALLERNREDNRAFKYGDVLVLAKIEDKDKRASLENKATAECWTSIELADAAAKLSAKPRTNAGRPHLKPKGISQLIDQKDEIIDAFLTKSEKVWSKPCLSLGVAPK
jgi:hypothetical protein